MADTVQKYVLKYVAETADAKDRISGLVGPLRSAAESSVLAESGLKDFGAAARNAAKNAETLGQALDELKKRGDRAFNLDNEINELTAAFRSARNESAQLGESFDALAGHRKGFRSLGSDAQWLASATKTAGANVQVLAADLDGLGSKARDLETVRAGMVGVQRSAYGAFKNVESLGIGLSKVKADGAGLAGLATAFGGLGRNAIGAGSAVKGFGGEVDALAGGGSREFLDGLAVSGKDVRKAFGGAARGAKRLLSSTLALAGTVAVLSSVRDAIAGVGEAIQDARGKSVSGAKRNLEIRDHYRELANLQGKAEPDNEVVGGAMRFRLATGLSDQQANDALRRFEGGLPSAKGNIEGTSTTGVAADFLRESARTGLRVDVKGGTTALLAAKIAQTAPVKTADEGVSKFASILDTLNRGDGDLDPLVDSLVKGSGGYVGDGRAFKDLGQFAAAESVASLNASPKVAATRVQQAVQGFNTLLADTTGVGGQLGLKVDDFAGNVEKLAPILDGKENQDLALREAGINNQAQRRSLLQFYERRKFLADQTAAADKGADPADVRKLNDRFFAGDLAQHRIALAENDAARFAQFAGDEPAQVLREKAEANLRRGGDLDTAASQADDSLSDHVGIRLFNALGGYFGGGAVPQRDDLPLFMGGTPNREKRIATEAERLAADRARAAGVDVPSEINRQFGAIDGGTQEERTAALAQAARARGGASAPGTGQTDALLRQLVDETRKTREAVEKGPKPPGPAFLPLNDRNAAANPFPRAGADLIPF